MGKICGITGHRLHTLRLPHDENGPALRALKQDMAATLDRLIQEEGATNAEINISQTNAIFCFRLGTAAEAVPK